MKLSAEIANQKYEIRLTREQSQMVAEIDGRRYELAARELKPGAYLLITDGRVYDCRVDAGSAQRDAADVHVGGRLYQVTLVDPKRLRAAQVSGPHLDGPAQIVAPMPGKVVRVLVGAGDRVKTGDGIVVVEAMKMQNEMKSPRTGTVKEIHVEAGATVNAGDVLALIE